MKDRANTEDPERLRLVRDKALRAVRMELKHYDWMSLDSKTAWKILAMLNKNDRSRDTR
jgi:hypothetical protein